MIDLTKIAELTGAVVTGDTSVLIKRPAKIDEATEGDITFLYMASYEKYFEDTKATAIFVKPGFNKTRTDITYLEVKEPNKAFATMTIAFFTPEFPLSGIDKSSVVAPSATLGDDVALGCNVVIGERVSIGKGSKIFHNTVIMNDTVIGENCLIFPNVTLREQTVVGNRVIIHSGAVIGSDGFGYMNDAAGRYIKIPQLGNVVLEDDVEIGSNTCIDRAATGSTLVKSGTKVDNLVQIAHNVTIGKDSALSAQSGISGSTKLGDNVILAGQVGLAGHLEIGSKVILAAQAGVSKSLIEPGMYFGSPAKPYKEAFRTEAHIRGLEDYAARIKSLEKKMADLEKKLGE